jgi:hypothetical protein
MVGMFNAPDTCLMTLSGVDGAPIWTTLSMDLNVTSLAAVSDLDEDGVADIAVGSYDNAVSVFLARNGLQIWRREVSTYNGGHILAVAAAGDVDGNGSIDIYSASFDHQAYVFGSVAGQMMSVTPIRDRAVTTAVIGDGDGDGRPELAVTGRRTLALLAGSSGLASGPKLAITGIDSGEVSIHVFAYPTTLLYVFYARETAFLTLPGFEGALGLQPAGLIQVYGGGAPGAGISGFILGPFPEWIPPTLLYTQAVTVHGSGAGAFSNVESFVAGR